MGQSNLQALMTATEDPEVRQELKSWALLAVTALAIAGVFALLLALSRTPGVHEFLPWDGQLFFRQALITHVDFSIVVWYLAAFGLVLTMAEAPLRGESEGAASLALAGRRLAWLSMLPLILPALLGWGEPSLNNYVPVIHHPLFYCGLAMLALGVFLRVIQFLKSWLESELIQRDSALSYSGLCGVIIYLLALVCLGLAHLTIPADLGLPSYLERLFWGAGHLQQFLNALLLMVAWLLLAEHLMQGPVIQNQTFQRLCTLLTAVTVAGPVIYLLTDILTSSHKEAFTTLYRVGLVVPLVLFMVVIAPVVLRSKGVSAARITLGFSMVLLTVGIIMGYLLEAADTRVPAHYHATIGGVNLALMGLFLVILPQGLGIKQVEGKVWRWHGALYGVGQLLFVSGMFWAGSLGVQRKVAGAAQQLDNLDRQYAMVLTGVGGVLAVLGGIAFVWLMLRFFKTNSNLQEQRNAKNTLGRKECPGT